MKSNFQKVRLAILACFLAGLTTACLDSSDSGSTDTNNPDNSSNQDNSNTSDLYVISTDNIEVLRQRITSLMSQNQMSVWHTRNELNPIHLATVLRDHLDYLDSGQNNEELTAELCSRGGTLNLSSSGNTHTFTYNQCSSPNEFNTANPFVRSGTLSLTETNEHWEVDLDLDFQGTEHQATLEFTVQSNTDYTLRNINLTRTPSIQTQNIMFLEDFNIVYNGGMDTISIDGIYGETARTDFPSLESGKVEVTSDNLNRLHDTSRGTVTLKGANNTQATIDFSSGSPVIQLDD